MKQWDKTFGGGDLDGLNALEQTSDGGYILGGWSYSAISGDKTQAPLGSADYWLVKVDSAGNKQWDKTYGGSNYDELTAVQQTSDGGYILGGWSNSEISGDKTEGLRGVYDFWVVKLDSAGNKQWDKTLGGNKLDFFSALQQTSDGGYVLGGWSSSDISGDKTEANKGIIDFWVVKLDSAGNKQWDKTLGGNESDQLNSLQQTSDGGYILGGSSLSDIGGDKTAAPKGGGDFWVVKLDSAGQQQWDIALGGDKGDALIALEQTLDGGFILGGRSSSGISGDKTEASRELMDYWVVKLDSAGNKLWDKTLGGNLQDELNAIGQAADGGYIVAGYSLSGISGDKTEPPKGDCCCFECPGDYWVVKLDSAGQQQWDKTLGGEADDNPHALVATSDGTYLIGGTSATDTSEDKTEPSRGYSDFWVVKLSDQEQVPAPLLLSFSPQRGLPGALVTITGQYLATTSAVEFNGVAATFTVLSDSSLTCKVPADATTGPITLVTAGGSVTSKPIFTVLVPRPIFRTFAPQQGLPGSQVTLSGKYLTTTSVISFNGVESDFTVLSDTSVTAKVPATATTGPVRLVTAGGSVTSKLIFTVLVPRPIFRTFAPQQGLPGSQVTLSGKNLTTTSVIEFNGVTAEFTVLSDTSITAKVPATATTGPVRLVTAGGSVTSKLIFTVHQPRVYTFFPRQGEAGTRVIVVGQWLKTAKEVRFNGVAATSFRVYFDFLLTAVVPAGATTGKISVVLSGGGQANSHSDFKVPGATPVQAAVQSAERSDEAAEAPPARQVAPAPFPNPFTADVTIPLELQAPATVQLSIYTPTGQLVRHITTGPLGAGTQQLQWNGRNSQGQPVATGIYFYRLLVNGQVRTGKLLKTHAVR